MKNVPTIMVCLFISLLPSYPVYAQTPSIIPAPTAATAAPTGSTGSQPTPAATPSAPPFPTGAGPTGGTGATGATAGISPAPTDTSGGPAATADTPTPGAAATGAVSPTPRIAVAPGQIVTSPTPPVRSKKTVQITEPPLTFLFKENPQKYYASALITPTDRTTTLLFSGLFILVGLLTVVFRPQSRRKMNPGQLQNYIGLLLVFLGTGSAIGVLYLTSPLSKQTRVFSPYTLLTSSWESYKTRFISSDGRVIDSGQGDITTSEAQSYAMLQAVWLDDKPTFDKVWNWTRSNLTRKTDRLFGWRWGKRADGTHGFMEGGGNNTASDADSDITLALILASRRWNIPDYEREAERILPDLWNIDTDTIAGKPYLIAGNWAKGNPLDVINPSYFAPYAWRLFYQVDPAHPWTTLIAPAYDLLAAAGKAPLDKPKAVGLPPDWIGIRVDTGALTATGLPNLTTNYSFDAMRIPWRVALDYQWNGDPQTKAYLDTLTVLTHDFTATGKLANSYTHDGTPISVNENPAMYATALGYFTVVQPTLTQRIYLQKIIQLYSNDTNSFRQDLPYYETNWLWFGSALYLDYLNAY